MAFPEDFAARELPPTVSKPTSRGKAASSQGDEGLRHGARAWNHPRIHHSRRAVREPHSPSDHHDVAAVAVIGASPACYRPAVHVHEAMIGFIMLMGLVTKNGILLVEFTNQMRPPRALRTRCAAHGSSHSPSTES